jgi:hypothetical protein
MGSRLASPRDKSGVENIPDRISALFDSAGRNNTYDTWLRLTTLNPPKQLLCSCDTLAPPPIRSSRAGALSLLLP